MHTYYRLGGLIEENDFWELRVNEIYEYRKLTYHMLGLFLDEINIDCNNKYEKFI